MFHVHLGIERKPVTSSRFRGNYVLDYCLLITTTPNFPILAYMRPKERAGQLNGICVFMTFDIWLHPADFGACHMVKELIKGEKTCFQEKKICYCPFTIKPCHLLSIIDNAWLELLHPFRGIPALILSKYINTFFNLCTKYIFQLPHWRNCIKHVFSFGIMFAQSMQLGNFPLFQAVLFFFNALILLVLIHWVWGSCFGVNFSSFRLRSWIKFEFLWFELLRQPHFPTTKSVQFKNTIICFAGDAGLVCLLSIDDPDPLCLGSILRWACIEASLQKLCTSLLSFLPNRNTFKP